MKKYMTIRNMLATLFLAGTVAMTLSGCSCNNSRTTRLMTTEQDLNPIFSKLADDMVSVQTDTGNFYICKYEVAQALWKEVMGDNPSQMQGDDLPVEQVNWD